jgi:hypothetical protein
VYPGEFFVTDTSIEVLLDGQYIGKGSAIHGVDITTRTTMGRHILLVKLLGGIRTKQYSVILPSEAVYEAQLLYDRMWGTFKDELQLQAKPLSEESWKSAAIVRGLLQEHIVRLSQMFQGKPKEQENLRFIQGVIADDLLAFAVDQITQKMPAAYAEKKISHATSEFGEWFIAITLCPWLTPAEVKTHLGQGYMKLLDELTRPALNVPGGRNVAHWIYCSNGERAGVHLTLIPNPQGLYKEVVVLAQDLLTLQECQQVGLAPAGGKSTGRA